MKRSLQISLSNLRYNLRPLLSVLILTVWYGCAGSLGSGEEGAPVATYADGTYLYRSELEAFMPDSLSPGDSARIAGQYIDQWVRQQVIAEQARTQIPDLDQQLRYRLRAYEQSLVEQAYTTHLVEQRPDLQQVPEAEIRQYYEAHPEKFIARTDYYQFFYLETPNPNQQYKVVNLIRSSEPEKIAELLEWCQENASAYKLDSSYLEAGALEPLSEGFYYGNLARASRTTPYPYTRVVGDTTYLRVFRMLETIEPGDRLPLSLCEERIATILRNQRKRDLIETEVSKLVQQAKLAGKVK